MALSAVDVAQRTTSISGRTADYVRLYFRLNLKYFGSYIRKFNRLVTLNSFAVTFSPVDSIASLLVYTGFLVLTLFVATSKNRGYWGKFENVGKRDL